jgi:LysR family transcriptional regulator, hydrogen peroxide-inducible genes activator
MNLRDLRYLVAVAEHLHFGRAAEACFVSQPTLSTQIKKLEDFLGVTLIERTNRQVILTPIGEAIVARARTILREVDQLVQTAEESRDPLGGNFRLGIIPTVAPHLLPRILPCIREHFPNLRIQLTEGQTAVISAMLKHGELDAVIAALPLDEDNVDEVRLYFEPFYLAVSDHHPKADQAAVTLADLEQEEVLLLEDGHCLRDQALSVCRSNNAVENTNFRATSIETLRQMVAANIGVTLMPELATRQGQDNVRYIPFSGEVPGRDVGLAWRSTTTRRSLLQRLAGLLQDSCRTPGGLAIQSRK